MLAEKKIKKHVAIIHAYSLMSALQRKIVNVLLYEATNSKNQLNHQESVAIECRIPFSSLYKGVKFNSNNTQYLKEAIDGLASLKIEWNLLKDKVPTDISFLNLRILHGPPTFYQDSTLNFSFHKVMLNLLDNPSIYGTVDLDLQSQFESKYSHSLYENSTRFVNLQKNKVIQLDTFRKLLGVHENKYPSMREFTRNVIIPSLEEVNDRADFIVNLENLKIGRKIIGFELSVNSKKKSIQTDKQIDVFEKEKASHEIKQTFGILSHSILENILKNYTEEYILEKITYTRKYAKKEKSGFYPVPYFISALRDDYKLNEKNQFQDQCLQGNLFDEKCLWANKLNHLQLDFNHWKKTLEFAEINKNILQIDKIKKIVAQCEENLKQHYLEHPDKQTV